jgi:hypothetical protein
MDALVLLCVPNLAALALCRLPLPPPLGLATATPTVAAAREVQELLLAWEEELCEGKRRWPHGRRR